MKTVRILAVQIQADEREGFDPPKWLPKELAAAAVDVPAEWMQGNGAKLVEPATSLVLGAVGLAQVGQAKFLAWARPRPKVRS